MWRLSSCDGSRRVFEPLVANSMGLLWHSVPIIVAISLVYGATRHERLKPILIHAYHTAVWIIGFMVAIGAVLAVLSYFA